MRAPEPTRAWSWPACCALAAACGGGGALPAEGESEGEAASLGCSPSLGDAAAPVFEAGARPRFAVELSDDDVESLERDPYTYVPAAFRWVDRDLSIPRVLFRHRGQTAAGAHPGYKVSFQETGTDLLGLKRLNLDGASRDATLLRELAFYRLGCLGEVDVPRASHATLAINGGDPVLIVNVEAQDLPYLAARWDGPIGNLYKVENVRAGTFEDCGECRAEIGWDARTIDADPEVVYELQTNEEDADVRDLVGLIALVHGPDAEFADEVESVVDVDATLALIAAELALCDLQGFALAGFNYRFYHGPDGFLPLPYDRDDALRDCDQVSGDPSDWPNLLARRLAETFPDRLDAARAAFADRALAGDPGAGVRGLGAAIRDAVRDDPEYPDAGAFDAAVEELADLIDARARELR